MKTKHTLQLISLIIGFAICNNVEILAERTSTLYGEKEPIQFNEGDFIKVWHILGPIEIIETKDLSKDEAYRNSFNENLAISDIASIDLENPISFQQKEYAWQQYDSPGNLIDLIKLFGEKENVFSYAYAEVDFKEDQKVLLGIGSDDAIKIWLNGKEIHSIFVGRAHNFDEDFAEASFKKGKNTLLVKILNGVGGYGYSIHHLVKKNISKVLVQKASLGQFDAVKMLSQYVDDISARNDQGINAWQAAKISGYANIADFIVSKGIDTTAKFPDLDQYISGLYKPLLDQGKTPGSAILVSIDGKIIYKKGLGYANIEQNKVFEPTTKFRIGSVSKQFIASSILKLQEKGKISTDDKLSKYLPDFPQGDQVTIYQLLTHTSGIHSYTNRPDFIEKVTTKTSTDEVLKLIMSDEYDFDPGEKWLYNNSGYFILGHIVELVSGKPLDLFLKEEFFDPLKMTNTGIYSNQARPDNEALGYEYDGTKYKLALDWDMSWAGGAGALYSTVEDLYKWNEALFNGKVLSDASLEQAFKPSVLSNGKEPEVPAYGFGWGLEPYRGIRTIGHGGGLHGFVCYLSRAVDEKINIVVFTNSTPLYERLSPEVVSTTIGNFILKDKLEPQEALLTKDISAEELQNFSGKYDYGQGMILTVTVEGNQIFAQMTGQPNFEIFPADNDMFYWKVVDAKIQFKRNEAGEITAATHFQGGMEIKVRKLAEKTEPD